MAEITVRAETAVLGLLPGESTTTEETPFIRAVIEGGRLSQVRTDSDGRSEDGPPSVDEGEAPALTGPYVARERLEDAPEPKVSLKASPEFDDAA